MDLLDFSHTLDKQGYTAYSIRDRKDKVCVVPRHLRIHRSGGRPEFNLEAVRGVTPFSKPKPYGMLEIQLSPAKINQAAVADIREEWPSSTFHTPDFSTGYLGLSMIAEDGEHVSSELESPIPLAHLPLSRLRFVRRISIGYLKMIKEALQKGILLLKGFGLFSVKGYAPRVPVSLKFNPETVTQSLIDKFALDKEEIPLRALKKFFATPLNEIPVTVESREDADPGLISACLADWYSKRFCTIRPPTADQDEVIFTLTSDAKSSGHFSWDLSQPLVAERYSYFTLDALREARQIVQEKGMDTLVTTTIVEPLPTGFLRVEIFHPFFQIPVGARQIGIKIKVPPNPPLREQAIHKTVVFDSGQTKKVISLQFSASEEKKYEVTPFAIYDNKAGTKEVTGSKRNTDEQELTVRQQDFPLAFTSLSCSPNLSSQASLTITVKKNGQEAPFLDHVILDSSRPSTMLALPKGKLSQFKCWITAKSLTSSGEVTTSLPMRSDEKIDLTSFREYGTHEVTIHFDPPGGKTAGVDLIPEHLEPHSSNITTVAFTADKKEITWRWFSPSIFKAGFRYRFRGNTNTEWSEVQSPFKKKLTLTSQNHPV